MTLQEVSKDDLDHLQFFLKENGSPNSLMLRNMLMLWMMDLLPVDLDVTVMTNLDVRKLKSCSNNTKATIVMKAALTVEKYEIIQLYIHQETESSTWQEIDNVASWGKNRVVFGSVPTEYEENIQELYRKHGIEPEIQSCDYFYLPKEKAAEIQSQEFSESCAIENITFLEIQNDDLAEAQSQWHEGEFAKHLIYNSAKMIGSAAGYVPIGSDDSRKNKMIGCVMCAWLGSINALHVHPQYRRHGVGATLILLACKLFLKRDLTPVANVVVGNTASKKLMEKSGFLKGNKINWCFEPAQGRADA